MSVLVFDIEKWAQTTTSDIVSMSGKRYRRSFKIVSRSFQNDIEDRPEFDIVSISFDIVFATLKKQDGFQDFFEILLRQRSARIFLENELISLLQ